jgi:NAD(P)H-flavin reductase
VSGPFGQLKVRLSHRPIIMIAGGSGLAPIESMSADLADRRNTRPVTVFFGARTAADLFHLERLEAIGGRMPAWRSSRCCPSRGPAGPARPGS